MNKLTADTVRDSLAIILTIGFVALMVLKGSAPQEFMDVYLLVIGFFFGVPRINTTTTTTQLPTPTSTATQTTQGS